VVFGVTAMTLIDGVEGLPITIDFTPMYYLVASVIPSSAAFGIFTKVFKKN